MHNWNMNNWGMPMMWFIWIPLIILVVWLVIKLTHAGQSFRQKKESPLEVLKKRYVNEEITKEDYEQRKKVLDKG